jgi:Na+-transporting NADH:ubiquinone oxidoreductase subunit NqrB
MALRDARDYQIIFLSGFLTLGWWARDWTIHWVWIAALISTCLLMQFGLGLLTHASVRGWPKRLALVLPSLKSALITALGLSLLLRTNHLPTLLLAGGLAIAAKFLLQVRGKHFINPANFGIISALLLTQDAWVSPGQWGTDLWLLAFFLACGGLVLGAVGRWDTSLVFLGVYGGLSLLRNTWLGWSPALVLHQLSSGSLLVFALFMLTDPRSIPDARWGRLLWSTVIAVLSFVLQYYFYLPTAPFWALFCCAPLTVLLDTRWQAPRFTWQPRLLSFTP